MIFGAVAVRTIQRLAVGAHIVPTIGRGNLAGNGQAFEARRMALLLVTAVLGVVLFDAHDYVNRRTHRR
jgi:hypothetical protein